ncbi:hypothetical protein WN944_015331 [Citrus x changshan-huyou]|uniref:Uncharacterized protein n=1 Tax=Citrus x changshan-huyou TaxID=2935761 RepID=A0AAP0QMK0_9ROSI
MVPEKKPQTMVKRIIMECTAESARVAWVLLSIAMKIKFDSEHKNFPWMSHASAVLLPPLCAHAIILQHTLCHIAPAAQIQPTQYLANTPAAAHDFFRLLSSSSDDDSMS